MLTRFPQFWAERISEFETTVLKPDVILLSDKLWDGSREPGRQALAIGGGKIIATGSTAEIVGIRGENTTVIDVGDRVVIPGLIDSHLHLIRAGLRWSIDPSWNAVRDIDDGLDLIFSRVKALTPGDWLAVSGGWSPNQLQEKRSPTRDELDRVAPRNPVFVQRNYIEAFLNSAALEAMGWDDLGDGRIQGPEAIQQLRARLVVPSLDEQIAGTGGLISELRSLGLTGCIDAGGFGMSPPAYDAIKALAASNLGFRVRMLVGASAPGNERDQIRQWMNLADSVERDRDLRFLGVGEVLLLAAHDMEGLDDRDISLQRDALHLLSREIAEAGWPIHIHAIRNSSVEVVLSAWSELGVELAPLRFAITHADQISLENLNRARELGLGLTIQNGMSYRGLDAVRSWGEASVRGSPPLRTIVDMGVRVAAGTDGTVVSSPNPWPCIEWMVTGKNVDGSGPRDDDQLLTIEEALRLYTSGSAWFCHEDGDRGTLEVGSLADLAVLSEDPWVVPSDELHRIQSVLTIVGGEVLHSTLGS